MNDDINTATGLEQSLYTADDTKFIQSAQALSDKASDASKAGDVLSSTDQTDQTNEQDAVYAIPYCN